jgi:hypothetical protein
MSNEIAPIKPRHHLAGQLVEVGDARAVENPIGSLLPREVRGPVNRLWACYSHLLPSSLSLASTIRVYLDDHGLHPDDVPHLCSRLLSPEYQSRHKFASDLLTSLAGLVTDIVRRRRAAEETAQRLTESAKERKGAPPAEFLSRLREIGRMDTEDANS